MGDEQVSIGMVVGLDHRDVELSVHDLLQELKTHPTIRAILDGGERVEWGAKTIPEGGFVALPRRSRRPGCCCAATASGLVNVPALKGIHYAIESGRLAAEAAWGSPRRAGALGAYDESLRSSFVWRDLRARAQHAAGVRGRASGGASLWSGAATVTAGRFPPGDRRPSATTSTSCCAPAARPRTRRPTASSRSTSSRRSSSRATGRATTSRATCACRPACPRELAELWSHMCPAQVYEVEPGEATAWSSVRVTPSNCVQCGAITAKGGRLTPPEGGSGPEYTQT